MGYDLYGNKNNSYFRASIWAWPSIMELVMNSKVLPDDVVDGMYWNDGQEVTEEQALELADVIEKNIGDASDDMEYVSIDESPMSQMTSQLIGALQASGARVEPTSTMTSTNAAHVKEFVAFCRESGGFEVH